MILERLSVSGFRSFANRFTFEPDAKFTVLSAPNGTGKSTLLDALCYGLLERHTVTGKEAEARFLCAGRNLTPAVEIDFALGGDRYRLTKTFLGQKSASLKKLERGTYVAQADNSAADDFVRELFAAEPAGRGAIDRSKHLGLAHVLWSPAHANFDSVPSKAGEAIRAMLDAAYTAVTFGEQEVAKRVEQEYQKYYTPNGAWATAVGSENIPARQRRVEEAREAAVTARAEYLRCQQLATDFADREAEANRLLQHRTDLREQKAKSREQVETYTDLTNKVERLQTEVTTTQRAYDDVTLRIAGIAEKRLELGNFTQLLQQAVEELDAATTTSTELSARIAALRELADNAARDRADVQRRSAEVTAAETYTSAKAALARSERLLADYETSSSELSQLRQHAASIVGPTRAELAKLAQATTDHTRLQATIAASALALEFTPTQDMTIDVVAGETFGARTALAGQTTTVVASDDSVVVDLPGFGRIRARGADGAKKARKEIAPIEALLNAAIQKYGSSEMLELADRTERVEALSRQIEALESSIQDRFGDDDLDGIRTKLAEPRAQIAALEVNHPSWKTSEPDAAAMRALFDLELQESGDAADEAQGTLRAVEHSKAEIDGNVTILATRKRECEFAVERCSASITAFEDDGLTEATRQTRQNALALAHRGAAAAYATASEALEAFPDDPRVTVANLEAAEVRAGDAYANARDAATRCRTQLDHQMTRGNYPKLVLAEETVLSLEADYTNAVSKAEATKYLYDSFERIRTQRVAAVVEPVAAASTRYFNRIAGTPFGSIQISEELAPLGLIAAASQRSMPIVDGTLSSGEKEQVYLSTRLALAEIIANKTGQRQLFVVDDALTSTDPYRARRFMKILEELSLEKLQVIVTTADPSRYLEVGGAKHVDLAAALDEVAAA